MSIYARGASAVGLECDQCQTREAFGSHAGPAHCLQNAKAAGWWVGPDGDCLCPRCCDEIVDIVPPGRRPEGGWCPPPGRTLGGNGQE